MEEIRYWNLKVFHYADENVIDVNKKTKYKVQD